VDPFVLSLAHEDLCFLAERDSVRRQAVFADKTGASWSELTRAALKPVGEHAPFPVHTACLLNKLRRGRGDRIAIFTAVAAENERSRAHTVRPHTPSSAYCGLLISSQGEPAGAVLERARALCALLRLPPA